MINRRILKEITLFFKITDFILWLLPSCLVFFLYEVNKNFPFKLGVLFRYILLRSLAKKVGDNVYLAQNVTIKNIKGLSIGNNVSIHNNCYLDAIGNIDIASDVSIAHNSSILSFEHSYSSKSIAIKYQPLIFNQVTIGNNVWVGCGVRILAGSIVHPNTIVGANSLVNREIHSGVYVGNPVKKIKGQL